MPRHHDRYSGRWNSCRGIADVDRVGFTGQNIQSDQLAGWAVRHGFTTGRAVMMALLVDQHGIENICARRLHRERKWRRGGQYHQPMRTSGHDDMESLPSVYLLGVDD